MYIHVCMYMALKLVNFSIMELKLVVISTVYGIKTGLCMESKPHCVWNPDWIVYEIETLKD